MIPHGFQYHLMKETDDSQFLPRANTTNLKNTSVDSLADLEESQFLQIAMDSPSKNWNKLKKFD